MLLRHGASEWNEEDRFTGWTDVPLSGTGRRQARELGGALGGGWPPPSAVHASGLSRAAETAGTLAGAAGWHGAEVRCAWQLNERDYGELEGWRRPDVRRALGESEYRAMHRGWTVAPPVGLAANEDALRARRRFSRVGAGAGESLAQVSDRVVQYWLTVVRPELVSGQNVLVVAHSNSLRVLVRLLLGVPESELASIEIRVCQPIVLSGACPVRFDKIFLIRLAHAHRRSGRAAAARHVRLRTVLKRVDWQGHPWRLSLREMLF
jgi:2,3-bisphosphoglycerate-dependent phosphoglycerate mutase